MKTIVADTYTFYVKNSKNTKFPKQFRNHKIIWNMREALLALWEGEITELVLPSLGTPGYNFEEFIKQMVEIKQIKKAPLIKYYELIIN